MAEKAPPRTPPLAQQQPAAAVSTSHGSHTGSPLRQVLDVKGGVSPSPALAAQPSPTMKSDDYHRSASASAVTPTNTASPVGTGAVASGSPARKPAAGIPNNTRSSSGGLLQGVQAADVHAYHHTATRRTRAETFPTVSSGSLDGAGSDNDVLGHGTTNSSPATNPSQTGVPPPLGGHAARSGYQPKPLQVNTNLASAFGDGLFSPRWQLKFQTMMQQENGVVAAPEPAPAPAPQLPSTQPAVGSQSPAANVRMREVALEPTDSEAVEQVVQTFNYLGLGESSAGNSNSPSSANQKQDGGSPRSSKSASGSGSGRPPRLIIPGTSGMRESGVMSAISPGIEGAGSFIRSRTIASAQARRSAHIPSREPFQMLKSPLQANGFRNFGRDSGKQEPDYQGVSGQENHHTPQSAQQSSNDHITPTRSLWIGNIDPTLTTSELTNIFSPFGAIESLRVLPDKECAFVNYFRVEDAIRAREEMQGGLIGSCVVKIGFGKVAKADAMSAGGGSLASAGPGSAGFGAHSSENTTMPPTRALWVGNLSPTVTLQQLQQLFTPYGNIESCRILTHKSCGFVNFETEADAIASRKAMNGKDIGGVQVRIGFAKVPTNTPRGFDSRAGTPTSGTPTHTMRTPITPGGGLYSFGMHTPRSPMTQTPSNATFPSALSSQPPAPVNHQSNDDSEQVSPLMHSGIRHYFSTGSSDASGNFENSAAMYGYDAMNYQFQEAIPPCPEPAPGRRVDQTRLREMRRKLDGHSSQKDVDMIFHECIDDVVDLSIDYFGNTVVQKLVERCNDQQVLRIIEKIAPHMAAIGVNKHGTWVIQKVIDMARTNTQIHNIIMALKPFTPPLLLDQFGNYVVQCCLRLGPSRNQFVFDSMHVKCWPIGQGRFGARAMRACLESEHTTMRQKKHVAIATVQNALPLSTNANGTILLTWLLDSSNLPGRYRVLAPKFVSHLAHLCTHKLASGTIFKIINQNMEADAREMMVQGIFYAAYAPYRNNASSALPGAAPQPDMSMSVLEDVLSDPMYGVPFIQKVLSSLTNQEEKAQLNERVRIVLNKLAQGGLGRPMSAPIGPAMNPFLYSPYFAAAAAAAQAGQRPPPMMAYGQRDDGPKSADRMDDNMYMTSLPDAFMYAQGGQAQRFANGSAPNSASAQASTNKPPLTGGYPASMASGQGSYAPYMGLNMYNNMMNGGMQNGIMSPNSANPNAMLAALASGMSPNYAAAPATPHTPSNGQAMRGGSTPIKPTGLEDQLQGQQQDGGYYDGAQDQNIPPPMDAQVDNAVPLQANQ